MNQDYCCNYLQYGDSLDVVIKLFSEIAQFSNKSDVLAHLKMMGMENKYLHDIILSYDSEYNNKINMGDFYRDINASQRYKNLFIQLGCRGFSYKILNWFEFGIGISDEINYRISLQSDKYLYYPSRVRHYLPRRHRNHIWLNKYPSICFALGKMEHNDLYIFNMQSDLVFQGPSVIRDHIRGWRKILFNEILKNRLGLVKRIFLAKSEDLSKCCHPEFGKPSSTPNIWSSIYDGTAMDFGMTLVTLSKNVNIQTLSGLPPVYVSTMYCMEI